MQTILAGMMNRKNHHFLTLTIGAAALFGIATASYAGRAVPPRPLVFFPPHFNPNEQIAKEAYRDVNRASDGINRAYERALRDFENSSEFQQAITDSRQARLELERLRAVTIKRMQESDPYKAAQIDVWKAQQHLDELRSARVPMEQLVGTAGAELLRKRQVLTQMEAERVANDPALLQARFASIDADAKVAALRRAFIESIKHDPNYRAAKAQLDSARARFETIGR